ncbi:hypothetical protein [Streptomyces sp. NPDC059080]|uniref:hypothetical protein n=1 Tax=Streptomyces sp. NPDC059080 TaxID=3346718 RepID=UPI003676A4B5
MNACSAALPATVRPTEKRRRWLCSDHSAPPMLDLLDNLGWASVETPEANIHATSPDGRVYIGWLPEAPAAWNRKIV